jgi:hypothetical protein
MAHPENAYAFNEKSLVCCGAHVGSATLFRLLDIARAWRMHESNPLVEQLKAANEFDELRRNKRYRDKLIVLLQSTANRPPVFDRAPERVLWQGAVARGMTVAHALSGFVLSWPCGCAVWNMDIIDVTGARSGDAIVCRHVGSEEHLRVHWMRAVKSARNRQGRPKSVQRVDDARNPSGGEVPQVHFKDGSALNIDGAWKHGARTLTGDERDWLTGVGWVLPDLL